MSRAEELPVDEIPSELMAVQEDRTSTKPPPASSGIRKSLHVDDLELLTLILRRDRDGLSEQLTSGTFFPNRFFEFARSQGLAGYLFATLEEADLLALFPVGLVSELRGFYEKKQKKTGRRLVGEMEVLRQIFQREAIDVIFLKGPFLSQRFYGGASRRLFWDIDLLVRDREGLIRSHRPLEEAGYARRSIPFPGYGVVMHFTHHFEYVKNGTKLDLHWSLGSHFSFSVDYAKLWTTSETLALDGKEFKVLSTEYVLVLLILSVLNDLQRGRLRLKSLVDLYMVLGSVEKEIDWKAFFQSREAEGLLVISLSLMDLMLTLLDCRQQFPTLDGLLCEHGRVIRRDGRLHALQLLERSERALRNKLWTFGLYRAGRMKSFCWWVISQPVKRVIYRWPYRK